MNMFFCCFFFRRENTENYMPKNRSHSGSGSITRIMRKICDRVNVTDFTPELCWGFKLYPTKSFFPIRYDIWDNFFQNNTEMVNKTMATVEYAIAMQFWNNISVNQTIAKSDPANAYKILTEKNCPKVYSASDEYF